LTARAAGAAFLYPYSMRILIGMLCLLPMLSAQQSSQEISNYRAQETDAKPNSSAVPAAYAIPTPFERVVTLRLKFDTDLLAGIEQIVKEQKIMNGVILNGIGSVRGYQVHQVSSRTLPAKIVIVKDPTMPADIAGMSGYIMNGRVHAHVTLATPDKAFGGHLEAGNPVLTFAIITIAVLPDKLDLSKLDDTSYR
jgi:predicted DNA-binding protein with PD1-like motif